MTGLSGNKMKNVLKKKIYSIFLSLGLVLLVGACGLNPQNADLDLNNTLPEAKSTVYRDAIRKLGMLGEIYGSIPLNVMSKNIADNTGTSAATSAEIPRDITEIVKSTLNGIGGNVTFIPYDPDFLAASVNTGYSEFENKLIPDVIVSGGITEFDRGLVTKGDSGEIDATIGDFGLSFEDTNKGSLAQVTLDFNLIDFRTLAGIPRIQAVNGIKLHKGIKEDSFGFTVKSVTFGAKGTIKKVQGRHAAVRLLVQLSMAQLVGRYQKLPYWRLLPGGQKDEVVIDKVLSDFYEMSEAEKIVTMQSFLYLYDYPVQLTSQLDSETQKALDDFSAKNGLTDAGVNQATYLALYENIPIDHKTKQRRKSMPRASNTYAQAQQLLQNKQISVVPQLSLGDANLKLWTNKQDYSIGETMEVSFSVDRPMFVRLVVINSSGEISTLFPNAYQSDNYCRPGVTYQIPPPQAEFSLDIGGPAGIDKIRGVASSTPIAAETLVFTEDGRFDEDKMSVYPVRAESDIVIN